MASRVSIVTITMNSEATVLRTIESVLTQTLLPDEYLVIDGGSRDKTVQKIEALNVPFIKILSEPDEGISDAMNKGVLRSTGDIIGILHSDDVYAPAAIKNALEVLDSGKHLWLYGKMIYCDSQNNSLCEVGVPFSTDKLKRFMIVNHPSVFARRELYEKVGMFSKEYRLAMDYEWAMRAAKAQHPVYVPKVIATMKLGGASSRGVTGKINAAREALKAKNAHYPDNQVENILYFYWSWFKLVMGEVLKKIPFGAYGTKFLRPYFNPNLRR